MLLLFCFYLKSSRQHGNCIPSWIKPCTSCFRITYMPIISNNNVAFKITFQSYISQLLRFARVSCHVADFTSRNKLLAAKLLNHGYQYHKLRKAFFSKYYGRHSDLVSKFNVVLKPLLQQGLLESEFYGDLVYKFRN